MGEPKIKGSEKSERRFGPQKSGPKNGNTVPRPPKRKGLLRTSLCLPRKERGVFKLGKSEWKDFSNKTLGPNLGKVFKNAYKMDVLRSIELLRESSQGKNFGKNSAEENTGQKEI